MVGVVAVHNLAAAVVALVELAATAQGQQARLVAQAHLILLPDRR
jgi:hypothetical protein